MVTGLFLFPARGNSLYVAALPTLFFAPSGIGKLGSKEEKAGDPVCYFAVEYLIPFRQTGNYELVAAQIVDVISLT